MTQQQYIKTLERKIVMVNRLIDARITEGQSYKEEARKHKVLLAELRKAFRRGFWGRSLSLTGFLF